MTPKQRLKHGNQFPFDAPDAWWEKTAPPIQAADWAHAAARGILADLTDRRGIKHELEACDEDIRAEIVDVAAKIIREAAKKK